MAVVEVNARANGARVHARRSINEPTLTTTLDQREARLPDHVPLWRRTKRRLRPPVERLLAPVGCVVGARTQEPLVALTFDDGPSATWTDPILRVLAEREAFATFFLLGTNSRRDPALVRQIRDAGHEIGLHGVDHTNLTTLSARAVFQRTRDGRRQLEDLTGTPVRWFRPPYGEQRVRSYAMVRAAGMVVVMWSAVGDDWLPQPPERAAELIVPSVSPGDIVLLHDGWEPPRQRAAEAPTFDRARMVDVLLRRLQDRGFRATSVGRLLEGRGVVRSAASLL